MGGCFSFCGEQPDASREAAQQNGKDCLREYLKHTVQRLKTESVPADQLKEVELQIAAHLKRLVGGAPPQIRQGIKSKLELHKVLPNFAATNEQLKSALLECQAVLGPPANPSEPAASGPEPTEDEIQSLNKALERLWEIDADRRLGPDQHYKLSHGGRAAYDSNGQDKCPDPLFVSVDAKKLNANSCTRTFVALLDNYEADNDKVEVVTQEEKMEMDSFMHALMRTPHMQYIHKILRRWNPNEIPESVGGFQATVFRIWFTCYGKGRGPKTSSGFEHTFVGEVDTASNSLKGMHNWIRFWTLERANKINYKGYCGTLSKEDQRMVSVRFGWEGADKDVSTFLVGTSVAFEFAMYTLAFLGYNGNCDQGGIYLGPNVGPIRLQTYSWNTPLGTVVKSAFLRGG